MWVLGEGKKLYLELMRNLSIQFVLAGFCFLIVKKAVTAFDDERVGDGVSLGFIAVALFFVLLLAVIANLKSFFMEFSKHATGGFDTYRKGLSRMTVWKRYTKCLQYLMTNCKLALFETVALVLGIYMVSVVGLFVAIDSAKVAFSNHEVVAGSKESVAKDK